MLDDSTDETTAIANSLVERFRREGFDIALRHRTDRVGYKAGALKEGLDVARGEFVAIFDADFMPKPDFLTDTLPFFQDASVAVVQIRWGHINRDYSFLTIAQSFALDGHFLVEQSARCWTGLFMNFNGTAGIWRAQAIHDAGGWQGDTLTEDLDLSYRAQLAGWRMKFLPYVVCPGELPVQMSAIKSQQHRWSKGSIRTAIKLIPRILRARLPLFTKYQAFLHLSGHMLYPCMLLFVLCALLLLKFEENFLIKEQLLRSVALTSLAFLGPPTMYVYAQTILYSDWLRRIAYLPVFLVFGTGIAVNNTRAILEAFLKVKSAFVRTPKYRIEKQSDTWLGKKYGPRAAWISLFETMIAIYAAHAVYLLFAHWQWFDGFLFILAVGLSSVAFLSLWEPFSGAMADAKESAGEQNEIEAGAIVVEAAHPQSLRERGANAVNADAPG